MRKIQFGRSIKLRIACLGGLLFLLCGIHYIKSVSFSKAKKVVSFAINVRKRDINSATTDNKTVSKTENKPKIILWYVKTRYTQPIPGLRPLANCPWQCSVTTNHTYQNDSSALLFAAQITKGKLPVQKRNQVFVLHNHEPQNIGNFRYFSDLGKPEWKNKFNWTMWYRADSDIHEPYGLIQKRHISKTTNKDFGQIFRKKTKMAAWVVSNCKTSSRREEYVKELQKYIDVDVFGACGKIQCERSTDASCLEMIGSKYKFYLSFESTICSEYITEKFFRYYNNSDFINVARGDGDSYRQVAPNGTYINTADFKSAKELAQYLKRLSENEDEYIEYLKRKQEYETLFEPFYHIYKNKVIYMTYHYEEQPLCELCQRLWNVDKYKKTYQNVEGWFQKKPCRPPSDLPPKM